ncbi:TetR/AcrR family transcriptional regulator [Luteimonas kalidii]|uniref:TetR/AcrR family transcriptional regulator n=1 Tax=Luteimonas kalidii TaxID=3042025 RepID=A0ABT6JT41_9GAMM|nr:TetR/AcrR family transcriptional regulator [Luteimonas kalidii]MDH5833640.1 TetR/AcrR family transcriptional regulator [Luteimonas kalidii]
MTPSPTKGATTREAILARSYALACVNGLEGLTIGAVAEQVGMSKSGVFAHFGSREDLQLATLDLGGELFIRDVLVPALREQRGLPRLRAIFANWAEWVRHEDDGGCLFLAAASEYDDRPGAIRDRVLQQEADWRDQLARAVQLAIDSGELAADTEPGQVAFELYAIALAIHHDAGLTGYEGAVSRGFRAFDRLLRSYAPTP